MHKTNLLGLMITLAATLLLIGCNTPTKLTGGGSLVADSAYPSEGGSFGFVGNSCEETIKGQFNYVDMSLRIDGGVKIHAQVSNAYVCEDILFGCGDCAIGEAVVEGTYRSTNPKFPGTGAVKVCLTDGGEGNGATDTAYISLSSGPFAGYSLGGVVQGNIQDHGCDDEL